MAGYRDLDAFDLAILIALVARAGGRVEIPAAELVAIDPGLRLIVGRDPKTRAAVLQLDAPAIDTVVVSTPSKLLVSRGH